MNIDIILSSFIQLCTPVAKSVLLSTKLAAQNKHFSAPSALKLTYRHLGFKHFPGSDTPGCLLEGKRRG